MPKNKKNGTNKVHQSTLTTSEENKENCGGPSNNVNQNLDKASSSAQSKSKMEGAQEVGGEEASKKLSKAKKRRLRKKNNFEKMKAQCLQMIESWGDDGDYDSEWNGSDDDEFDEDDLFDVDDPSELIPQRCCQCFGWHPCPESSHFCFGDYDWNEPAPSVEAHLFRLKFRARSLSKKNVEPEPCRLS